MESSCKKNPKNEEKGLGSLPNAILVCILSLFPTKVVVRTSILCQLWRYLWTEVTAVEFQLPFSNQSQPMSSIMSRLASPTLLRFSVITNHFDTFSDRRCCKLACDRKVEENLGRKPFDNIEMLLDSCPLLEVLDMRLDCPINAPCISIIAFNLKSLYFKMCNAIDQHQVIIDAPKLTYLYVIGGGSLIDFNMEPTILDTGMDAMIFFVKHASLWYGYLVFGNCTWKVT
ncbi:hypothetical protein RDABS01_018190 [Bienertia sinuspersici]